MSKDRLPLAELWIGESGAWKDGGSVYSILVPGSRWWWCVCKRTSVVRVALPAVIWGIAKCRSWTMSWGS